MTGRRPNDDSFASLFEQSSTDQRGRARIRQGDRLEVTVVALGKDAIFADLGGKQEGYFDRITLLDAGGKLRVAVGARVSAIVQSVDKDGQALLVPVSVRGEDGVAETSTVAPQPTTASGAPMLMENARVKGKVTGIERYGLFVQINGTNGRNGRGLVPVSETSMPRGADLKRHFSIGQDIEVKILNIAEDGKIRLSIGALAADEDRANFEAYQATGEVPAAGAAAQPGGKGGAAKKAAPVVKNFGTLGDLLAKKKK
jgi:small subunit ribosomal protein S1